VCCRTGASRLAKGTLYCCVLLWRRRLTAVAFSRATSVGSSCYPSRSSTLAFACCSHLSTALNCMRCVHRSAQAGQACVNSMCTCQLAPVVAVGGFTVFCPRISQPLHSAHCTLGPESYPPGLVCTSFCLTHLIIIHLDALWCPFGASEMF
jgi:hypothetical protein